MPKLAKNQNEMSKEHFSKIWLEKMHNVVLGWVGYSNYQGFLSTLWLLYIVLTYLTCKKKRQPFLILLYIHRHISWKIDEHSEETAISLVANLSLVASTISRRKTTILGTGSPHPYAGNPGCPCLRLFFFSFKPNSLYLNISSRTYKS